MTPLVIAHRGASWHEPENTLAAFRRAIDDGADFVELDVHVGADGRLLVCHDRPLASDGLCTLEEALEAMRGRVGVMIDLKLPYRYRAGDLVGRTLALLDSEAIVASAEPRALEEVHRLRAELRTVQHVQNVSLRRASAYAWGAGLDEARTNPRTLAAARRLGLATAVYTVNRPERMRELAALGATAIITDRPDLLRRTLEAKASLAMPTRRGRDGMTSRPL